jgi:SAM-dependent methyltransferase
MNELPGIYHRAEIYDAIYQGRGKQYKDEAVTLAERIRERNPAVTSLLDVACGTGAHLRYFAGMVDHVEGLDLAEDMLRVARANLPGVPLHQGDMCDFDLGRRFDAVTCMFSSIGYLEDAGRLNAALRCFAGHLNPGGVVVVEPWWTPEKARSGQVVGDLVTVDGLTISRVSHVVRSGAAHRMRVHYLVADAASGIRHFTDTHLLSVFHRREYEAAFTGAGCSVEFVETRPDRPGLYIGVKKPAG